jgi:hypothetical protein
MSWASIEALFLQQVVRGLACWEEAYALRSVSEWDHPDHMMPLVGYFNRTIVWIASLLNNSCAEGWGNPQCHIVCCSEGWQIG